MSRIINQTSVCISLCVGLVLGATKGEAIILDGVVAQVGDEVVLLSQVRERVNRESMMSPQKSVATNSELSVQISADRMEKMRDVTIDELLMKKDLSKRGLAVTAQELDAAVHRMMEKNGLDKIGFTQALAAMGFTPLAHRTWLKRQLARAKFAQGVAAGVRVSEAVGSLKAKLLHISFPVTGEPESADDRASERLAREFVRRVNSGEHFASVAASAQAKRSTTGMTDLGEVALAGLIPEFEQAVRSARVGEATGPFRTVGTGWCVLLVQEWVTGGRTAAALSASALDQAVQQALSNLRRKTYVKKHKIAMGSKVDVSQ